MQLFSHISYWFYLPALTLDHSGKTFVETSSKVDNKELAHISNKTAVDRLNVIETLTRRLFCRSPFFSSPFSFFLLSKVCRLPEAPEQGLVGVNPRPAAPSWWCGLQQEDLRGDLELCGLTAKRRGSDPCWRKCSSAAPGVFLKKKKDPVYDQNWNRNTFLHSLDTTIKFWNLWKLQRNCKECSLQKR